MVARLEALPEPRRPAHALEGLGFGRRALRGLDRVAGRYRASAQGRAPYPLSSPAIEAVLAATRDEAALVERVKALRESRDRLARELGKLRAVTQVFESSANFLLVRFRDPALVMAATREAGIILRDRSREPGLDGLRAHHGGLRAENEALLAALARTGGAGLSRTGGAGL